MRRLPRVALAVALAACGRSEQNQDPPPPGIEDRSPPRPPPADAAAGPATAGKCAKLPFADSIPVPEASGADWFDGAGGPRILVVSDSGNLGAWAEIDPDDGAVLASGKLRLDAFASDDLEGLAVAGDTAYAITSSGRVREWKRGDAGWEVARAAYPLGPPGDQPAALACADARAVNCGKNWEGLCLADPLPGGDGCAGYAVSKTDGALTCVVLDADRRLVGDPKRVLHLDDPERLTGCEISPEGDRLWVGANLFGRNRVWAISEWRDPARARVQQVGDFGPGFGEAIAIAPGAIVYRFSDTGGGPSRVEKWGCR